MLQRGLTDECYEAMHIFLPMQSMICAYILSNQLVSGVKGMLIGSPNTRKVTCIHMINLFLLNGMETQGFHQLHYNHLYYSATGPAV